MSPGKHRSRSLAIVLSLLLLAATAWAGGTALGAKPAPETGGAAPARSGGGQVSTASDAAQAKISTSLRGASGAVDIAVYHNVAAKAAVQKVSANLHTRAYTMPDGSTVSIGKVDASQLIKLASIAGVSSVTSHSENKPLIQYDGEPKKPVVDGTKLNADAKAKGIRPTNANLAQRPTQPEGWWDVGEGHNARAAWENGYDGEGIIVAVVDSGVDFGHPDLQGTQAILNGGPYEGWPMAYDDLGNANWEILGRAQTIDEWNDGFTSNYVDTSQTVSAPTGVTVTRVLTTPLFAGGEVSHVYTMPTTSQSGVVHYGFHPDPTLGAFWTLDGNQPAIVVVDEAAEGVYDTVYVDLDDDHDFTNDIPMTKSSPLATLDWTGDGLADQSAGMLYWISDGELPNPGAWIWSNDPLIAGAGDLVTFMYTSNFEPGGDHGQHCASNIVAQGIANGVNTDGNPPPPYKPAGTGGMVWGTANRAKVAALRGVYSIGPGDLDANLYAALGADGEPDSGDEANISSNSYGASAVNNDGWDQGSRDYASINYYINPNMTILFGTGNSGFGYGTITTGGTSPTVIGVGGSTTWGSTVFFDQITSTQQINFGDPVSFSGRGASALSRWGPSVLGNGARGTGDNTINENGDGDGAYDTWGGVSRSTPLAAGIVALIYDAFMENNGRYPNYSEARRILMSSANDNGSDVYQQGAGVVDALRATNAAAGISGLVANPSALQPGSYDGVHYGQDQAFMNIMTPGASSSHTISVTNASTTTTSWTARTTMLEVSQVLTFSVAANNAVESPYITSRPDYIVHQFVPGSIPADTAMMVVHQVYPFENFNPTASYTQPAFGNAYRVLAYDWTDVNGDGDYWVDANGNGAVNNGEVDQWEINRYDYGYAYHTEQQVAVGYPAERFANGLLIGVQHQSRLATVAKTTLTIRVTFYRKVDFNWLTLGSSGGNLAGGTTAALQVTADVPANAKPGLYAGAIELVEDAPDGAESSVLRRNVTQIPVSIAVAATSAGFSFAGGPSDNTAYDNNVMFGGVDWYNSDRSSGDRRIYNADVPASDAGPGKFWLVNTSWYNYPVPANSLPTDLDTHIYGPSLDQYSADDPATYGPYTLNLKARSVDTNLAGGIGVGIWRFQTATGTTEEWLSGPLSPGLNQIQVHTVLFNGRRISEPFEGRSGVVTVDPFPVAVVNSCSAPTISIDVSSTMTISPLAIVAAGLSRPISNTYEIEQNETLTYTFSLENPALLDVRTLTGGPTPAPDVDLVVYHREGDDWVQVGASGSATSDEQVEIRAPAPGEYMAEVFGFDVTPSPGTFILLLANIDGNGLTLQNPPDGIAAGETVTLDLTYDPYLPAGTYQGAILMGPAGAASAIYVPITVTVDAPCATVTPTATQTSPPTVTATSTTVPSATPTVCAPETYGDVSEGDYFWQAVNWLYCRGATDASPAGSNTFKPYDQATRAVILKMIVLANGFPIDTTGGPFFDDVPADHPYYQYVETGRNRGIISGYNDAVHCGANSPCFLPDANVTRGQIAKIVVEAQDWELVNPATQYFVDVPPSDHFYRWIETARAHYLVTGYDCGEPEPCPGSYYRPGNPATRGQVAKIVYLAVTTPAQR